jgi:hypothetical protein
LLAEKGVEMCMFGHYVMRRETYANDL